MVETTTPTEATHTENAYAPEFLSWETGLYARWNDTSDISNERGEASRLICKAVRACQALQQPESREDIKPYLYQEWLAINGRSNGNSHRQVSIDDTQPVAESNGLTVPGVRRFGNVTAYALGARNRSTDVGIKWAIDEWIARNSVTVTMAPDKRGKTTQAMRRAYASLTGSRYLANERFEGFEVQQGRVLVLTQMDEDDLQQLLMDDSIDSEPFEDASNCLVVYLDEHAPESRQTVISEVCRGFRPSSVVLDGLADCFGLSEDGIKSGPAVRTGFELLRQLCRLDITFDALYHLNKSGNPAYSLEFTAQPSHYYIVRGDDASDVKIEYKGRSRAIPRVRRLTGNGDSGYYVENLSGKQVTSIGRPATTDKKLTDCLRTNPGIRLVDIASKTGLTNNAVSLGLRRMEKSGTAEKIGRGSYRLVDPLNEKTDQLVGQLLQLSQNDGASA